uniref:NADP-dependent oxidoreductase domain-containing protein n=1 Tax=Chromera velia CCMP2878 TaxID=1169474 RepID=A0A0G4HPZ6_9ALVE|eukprot:Cvel_7848.t1-p1 / transcript=Cvel_7848.t1 / gene=Cvel_7848 / organism=Chromera_velia_CCMP2878 / gene_product=Prostaglandin F synthase, putative / transcript_product=Prostaglandin F synthase, putative / location=Cvel_scaffold420:19540-22103(+) / protein_length=355 / sequence_SO=supercontig / SO=protein_coding / is_pseudo=false
MAPKQKRLDDFFKPAAACKSARREDTESRDVEAEAEPSRSSNMQGASGPSRPVPMVTLNNGRHLPMVGLGTYRMKDGKSKQPIAWAVETGYRYFDTASVYANERDVGEALKNSGLKREDYFISTKLWRDDMGTPEKVGKALEKSLKNLGVEYVDLWLMHWPSMKEAKKPPGWTHAVPWRAMQSALREGKARAIGVCSFSEEMLEDLRVADGVNVTPAVNQVEFHPFLVQRGLLEYCKKKGIQLQAFASVKSSDSPKKGKEMLESPEVMRIAKEVKKTPAQVLLRWSIEQGVLVIPRSTSREHIEENVRLFDFSLSPSQVQAISSLDRGTRLTWKGVDPAVEAGFGSESRASARGG